MLKMFVCLFGMFVCMYVCLLVWIKHANRNFVYLIEITKTNILRHTTVSKYDFYYRTPSHKTPTTSIQDILQKLEHNNHNKIF